MDSQSGSAARVGFVILIGTLLVIAGFYLVGGGGGFFSEYTHYHLFFPSVTGLRSEARVYLDGAPAGKVDEIGFSKQDVKNKIVVTIAVESKLSDLIREDSLSWLQSEGLLGDKAVMIKSGDPSLNTIPERGTIKTVDRSLIAEIIGPGIVSGTSDLVENMITLLREINSGQGTLGQLLRNPELYENLNQFTKTLAVTTDDLSMISRDLKGIIAEVRQQKGTLGKLIFSEEYARGIQKAVEGANRLLDSLARVVEPVSKGEGTLGRLLREDGIYKDFASALSSFSSVSGRVERALIAMSENKSLVGRALGDPDTGERFARLVASLEQSSAHLQSILAKVDGGPGSANMFISDPSIAASIRDTFLGVSEGGVLRNVARRAEETGRGIQYREQRQLLEASRRETERSRKLEIENGGRPLPATGPSEGGKAVPAVPRAEGPEGAAPSKGTSPPAPEGKKPPQ
jgi:phospholipid/cholesterol/gamma-HCH transport system substrate-binding protein